jgi:hypothetical protein
MSLPPVVCFKPALKNLHGGCLINDSPLTFSFDAPFGQPT